jgi:hypothetical protein
MKITRTFSCWLVIAGFLASISFAADAPAKFNVSGLNFTRPASWEWVKVTSSMRAAQLRVADEASKTSADVIFFSGFGGSVKDNVDRWFAQFEEPRDKINAKTEEVTVGKRKVTYASAQGTYLSGMPGGPKTPMKNHTLLGAIVEAEGGNIFVRMTGPTELVQKSNGAFRAMIEGAMK